MAYTARLKEFASVVTLVAAGTMVGSASAQEVVKLKVADTVPTTHYTSRHGTVVFMEKARQYGGGKLDFEYYPGGQLGKPKDMLALTQAGVADIGYVVPAYTPDKLSLSSVAELPGQANDSCEGTKAFYDMTQPGGFLEKEEFKPQGVRVLFAAMLSPYKMILAKKQVSRLEDVRGLKLRTTGGAFDLIVRSLGGVSVQMPGPDLFHALSRGTVDGALYPFASIKPFDLTDHVRYATTGVSLGNVVLTYAIGEAAWTRLPSGLREALVKAGREASIALCNFVETNENEERIRLTKDTIKLTILSDSERKRWIDALAPVKEQWAAERDKRGQPGSKAVAGWSSTVAQIRSK